MNESSSQQSISDKTGERTYPMLSKIASPADLKKLSVDELPAVCDEIRSYLIANLSNNPGHFGSSMGAVDIIVALHYVFDMPQDHIVFDVGHQAYAHKLLTGRFEAFSNQRKKGGISGFPFPGESLYDTFVCGHASNSISAALGMAIADLNTPGKENCKTVALIGDASISGGLAFEGLNNASQNPNNLLIVLNDNDMSIDDNVGALHRYLSDMSTSSRYNRMRFKAYKMFKKMGLVTDKSKGFVLRLNNAIKSLVAHQQNIFEGLNIRYFGPFNGNDVKKVVKVLQDIKEMSGSRILHLHTKKGKGFLAAEKNPGPWHAPGRFDPETATRAADIPASKGPLNWQEVFGRTLVELADSNENIMGITAGMASGTSMNLMKKYPKRMFDVGIEEGHAVTFAGGLASAGKRPFVAIYSSFLQRAFDNIIHDVSVQGLPVTFCIDRAGIVGEDGVTHHGMFDIAYLRMIPGMKIAVPSDAETLRDLMYTSTLQSGPLAIRYPRGKSDVAEANSPLKKIPIGKGRKIIDGIGDFKSGDDESKPKIAVLTVGPLIEDAKSAINSANSRGANVDLFDMIWVKPIDEELLEEIASKYQGIITIEDGVIAGGFGSAVREWFGQHGHDIPIIQLGIPDTWVYQGSVEELHKDCGYDEVGIARAIENMNSKLGGL